MSTELLAPAGRPDAGYAALEYGADAVYCGLTAFSARAEAVNFTTDELALFARHAHSLAPRRRVYLTLNILLKGAEVGRAVDAFAAALDCGVDAIIIQDLGLAAVAREYFPGAELHASTQMAIHSLGGARKAKDLGFRRVTLARELTLPEIADICAHSGAEIETFIHGTLCYSYSGLCLFSSMLAGRSGNRGRCAYSCRGAVEIRLPPENGAGAHPFSLKDMALEEDVLRLAEAGVRSFKIEGRKKSPLYVAATVDYYRRLLDGTFAPGEQEECRARLQTIFARPWTKLFLHSRRNPDAADTGVVGHRGAPLGAVGGVVRTPAGQGIRFRAARAVERHDGLQIDIPGEARPFGFAVDNLYLPENGGMRSVFAAEAGAEIAVALPEGAAAGIRPGLPVYQSSSQEVKRSYPFAAPRSGTPPPDIPLDVRIFVEKMDGEEGEAAVTARADFPVWLAGGTGGGAEITLASTLPCFPARDAEGAAAAARNAFLRTGGGRFFVRGWAFENPDGIFIRPGGWNGLRRAVLARMELVYAAARAAALGRVREALAGGAPGSGTAPAAPADSDAAGCGAAASSVSSASFSAGTGCAWSLVVPGVSALEGFTQADWGALDEIILPHTAASDDLARLADAAGREKIRLSLPFIARGEEAEAGAVRAQQLLAAGAGKWLVPGLGQRAWLGGGGSGSDAAGAGSLDLCADWSLYALNARAVFQLRALGFSAFSISPEDDGENAGRLLREFPGEAVLTVYGDVPLFISAACAHSHLGLCPLPAGGECGRLSGTDMDMGKSGRVSVFPQMCGSVVVGEKALSLPGGSPLRAAARRLRVDLRWRARPAGEVLAVWRAVREGGVPAGAEVTEGNFSRRLR